MNAPRVTPDNELPDSSLLLAFAAELVLLACSILVITDREVFLAPLLCAVSLLAPLSRRLWLVVLHHALLLFTGWLTWRSLPALRHELCLPFSAWQLIWPAICLLMAALLLFDKVLRLVLLACSAFSSTTLKRRFQ